MPLPQENEGRKDINLASYSIPDIITDSYVHSI